ncbi:TonB-dependent receptor [Flammeovirga pectinis]|uniref:TonB-dependent receptor n=1 Tax=Flammeovirga pectinis TaxID=2494373 RepID=A0A3S9NZJ9_9BACT|nr:TonB-dependent receptor [Flammeovirga pectinis]AZQ61351.1 TonB-dependent receptor [Flammeovirga pectinis]
MKSVYYLIFTVFFCGISFQNYAQNNGSIEGKVIDPSGDALPYAQVTLENTAFGVVTDADGNYSIKNVPYGEYIISAYYLGFDKENVSISLQSATFKLQIKMQSDITELDGVTVYGEYTKGQAKSLNEQKNAIGIKNIVSSEQFSTMPDRNGAEALQRIPGISIVRNRGEGQNIQIRGMASEYNQVQMNGTPMPGGEESRGAALDFMSADIMESIEIKKTLTPDMDGGAIGGAVNFSLKDAPSELSIKGVTSGGKNFHADPFNDGWGLGQQNHSLYIGNRFFNDKLGIFATGNYYQTNRGTVLEEYTLNDDDQLSRKRWNDYDVRRIRYGYNVGMDYQFNKDHTIRASYNSNFFNDDRRRGRTNFNYDYVDNSPDASLSKFSEDRETQTRAKRTVMDMFGIGGDHTFKNGITLDYKATHIVTTVDEPDGTQYYFTRNVGVDKIEGMDPWGLDGTMKIDPNNLLEMNKPVRLDTKENQEIDNSFVINASVPFKFLGEQSTLSSGYKLWHKDKTNTARRYMQQNNESIYMQTGTFYRRDLRFTDSEYQNLPLDAPTEVYSIRNQNYQADEMINAAYLIADLQWTSKFNTLIGARVEHTKNGYSFDEFNEDNGDYIRTLSDNSDYINILPSINAVYRFDERTSLKAAVAQGLSRPSFTSLIPREVIDDENYTISLSNPNLKPVTSTNFDFIFERYTSNMGYFTFGMFAKFLENQIYTSKNIEERDGQQWEISKPENGGSSHLYGFEVAYNKNLKDLNIPMFKWVNIMANYTFTLSEQELEDGRTVVMGNSPRDMANVILTYDNPKNGFMIALAGNYRGPLLISVADREDRDVYFNSQFHLDLSASYHINNSFTVFTQMNNLTNQMEIETYGNPIDQPILHQTEQYGPTVTVGLKFEL